MRSKDGFAPVLYLLLFAAMLVTAALCVCLGSVSVPLSDVLSALFRGGEGVDAGTLSIIRSVRLPRVICVAEVGAALSVCGAAMQGLLKNPLADGSTLGVSTGASLGAALAIAFGFRLPFLPFSGTMIMASLFAFLSLLIILALAFRLDNSLSTNTIILIGIIWSMFVSSILSLVVTFASDRLKQITFWTMGSLSGSSYENALILLAVLLAGSLILLRLSNELNAFAIGEDNARSVGVNVRRVRLTVLITVSVMIGVCVSVGGSIAFVGLVTPHIVRMITGPDHRKLLPCALFGGAVFLLLADLTARMILRPLELNVGVVTSFVGAILFVYIYFKTRRTR